MAARPSANQRRSTRALFGSRTDIGCVREHNEDSLIVAPPLFAVADGMGGHAAGEVASEIAVRTMQELAPATPNTEQLAHAVVSANYAVINAAQANGRAGMGTTLTAAILDKERLAIAQVGDSRAYLLHAGKMQQLTRDHSLMTDMIEAGELTAEEARTHPQRSVITRALGSDPDMAPDLYELNVVAGDRLLLCSDGLSTMLSDADIERLLVRTRDPQRCATVLVNEAIAAGGHDNITVIVVDVQGNTEAQQRKVRHRSRAWALFIMVALLAVVAGICYGAYAYTQSTAYLTAEDGKVVVYRGMPDDVFGFELSSLDHVTDIKVDELQPGTAARLSEGVIRVDNMAAADRLVEEYQDEIDAVKRAEEETKRSGEEAKQKAKEAAEAKAREASSSSSSQAGGGDASAAQTMSTDAGAYDATAAGQGAYDATGTGGAYDSTGAGTGGAYDGTGTGAGTGSDATGTGAGGAAAYAGSDGSYDASGTVDDGSGASGAGGAYDGAGYDATGASGAAGTAGDGEV